MKIRAPWLIRVVAFLGAMVLRVWLATVGMLSALPGAEAQLQSHMTMSMNTGLTAAQMQQAVVD